MWSLLLSFALVLPGGSRVEAAEARPDSEELAVFCAANEEVLTVFRSLRGDDEDAVQARITALSDSGTYRQLPKKIRCGKRSIRLVPRGYGTYVTGFMLSGDQREMVVAGGHQNGALDGADGFCLFRKSGEAWDVIGCHVTGVS